VLIVRPHVSIPVDRAEPTAMMVGFTFSAGSMSLIVIGIFQSVLAQAQSCEASGGGSAYQGKFKSLGCYNDSSVSILSDAKVSTIAMTPQYCADFCGAIGYAYGGIEFTTYVHYIAFGLNEINIVQDNASVVQSPTTITQTRSASTTATQLALLSLPSLVAPHTCMSSAKQHEILSLKSN
jgi:hypothetical protein